MSTPTLSPAPLLEMQNINKAFAGIPALSGARLDIRPGEIHALIGENGAGKSTLIKILTGAYRRDGGTITFQGKTINFQTPRQAQDGGISTIYQEVNLVPYRSIAENIFLGREPRRFGLIDWKRLNREAGEALARLGITTLDVTQPLLTLNIALQQMTAIARAVSLQSKLVVMDEPTSSLDDGEVATLFTVLRGLKAEGVSVIYVSHKLDELFALCDRITVMRDGRTIDTRQIAETNKLELVSRMLGREPGEVQQAGQTGFRRENRAEGAALLQAEHLKHGRALQDASLTVREGEIVGLSGLLGSGRTEVARAIFGADSLERGTVRLGDTPAKFHTPADAIKAGLGFCSEDRKGEGIIPNLSVRENMTLAALPMLSRSGVVSRAQQREIVEKYIQQLGIKTSGPEQPIKELSGGNQQKVLLARWLCLNPKLLILDEPTRGIDVGAKAEIQALIGRLADDGLGVLMISSEVEEVLEGSDRVVVMRDGRSVANMPRSEATQETLFDAMAQGGEEAQGEANGR